MQINTGDTMPAFDQQPADLFEIPSGWALEEQNVEAIRISLRFCLHSMINV